MTVVQWFEPSLLSENVVSLFPGPGSVSPPHRLGNGCCLSINCWLVQGATLPCSKAAGIGHLIASLWATVDTNCCEKEKSRYSHSRIVGYAPEGLCNLALGLLKALLPVFKWVPPAQHWALGQSLVHPQAQFLWNDCGEPPVMSWQSQYLCFRLYWPRLFLEASLNILLWARSLVALVVRLCQLCEPNCYIFSNTHLVFFFVHIGFSEM